MRRWMVMAVVVVVVVCGLAVLGAGRGVGAGRADFRFINRGDVNTLDVSRMSWMQDMRVARCLFEGLVRTDPFTHEFAKVPGVAERWEVSEDERVYTFHLRADARWSNGDPVRAEEFVYSWRRAMLPEVASDYIGMTWLIKGARAFSDWREEAVKEVAGRGAGGAALWEETCRRFDEMVGVRAVDERTLVVELERPVPYFLDVCSMCVFFPLHAETVEAFERPDERTGRLDMKSGWTKPGVLVSNGAFRLARWRFKREMRLERNEYYWDAASVNIDSISMPTVDDPNAQVLAFESGAVDWVSDVTPSYRADMLAAKRAFHAEHAGAYEGMVAQGLDPVEIDRRLPDDERKNIHAFPAFGTYFYNFNCMEVLPNGRPNPFSDARVRRAFAMCVDKKRIVEDVRRVGERVAGSLIPPGSIGGYASPRGLGFDPAGGRALLAEAGYPGGRGLPTVEILVNKDGDHDVIAQAIRKDWEEHLGVSVTIAVREIKVFRNDVKEHDFVVSRASWYGDYGDPTTFLDLNRTGDGNNDRAFSSARFDAMLDAAAEERDPVKRMAMLSEAERVIVEEELPLVPVFHYSQLYLFDPDVVTGITSHPRQEQCLYRVDMLGDGKGAERAVVLPAKGSGDDRAEEGSDDGVNGATGGME